MRKHPFLLAGFVVFMAIVGVPCVYSVLGGYGGWFRWWQLRPPSTRDETLLGTWIDVSAPAEYKITTKIVLLPDGKGASYTTRGYKLPFDWGTGAGALYTRRMATDAWSGHRFPYSVSADGHTVSFGNTRMFSLVTSEMRRLH